MTDQYSYEYYDKRADKHARRCIDGSMTGKSKCVGYCTYTGHEGFLTEKLTLEEKS